MIVALLCAALVAQDQDPPRQTIEQRALIGALAFPRIGEQFGETVVAGPDVADDVVFIAITRPFCALVSSAPVSGSVAPHRLLN